MERGILRVSLVLGAAAVIAHLAGAAAGVSLLPIVAKPIPVLCLAAWALAVGDRFGRTIALGLALSGVGDLLLALPGDRFLAGLGAFLIAHLVYIAAFTSDVKSLRWQRSVPFLLFGVAVLLLLWPGLGTMAVPVAVYTLAIAAMMWRAAARLGASPRGPASERLAMAGALAFAASDTLLAIDRFHMPVAHAWLSIMLLYWTGQLGIALSAGREGTAPE